MQQADFAGGLLLGNLSRSAGIAPRTAAAAGGGAAHRAGQGRALLSEAAPGQRYTRLRQEVAVMRWPLGTTLPPSVNSSDDSGVQQGHSPQAHAYANEHNSDRQGTRQERQRNRGSKTAERLPDRRYAALEWALRGVGWTDEACAGHAGTQRVDCSSSMQRLDCERIGAPHYLLQTNFARRHQPVRWMRCGVPQ
jgi:hypothetical protein